MVEHHSSWSRKPCAGLGNLSRHMLEGRKKLASPSSPRVILLDVRADDFVLPFGCGSSSTRRRGGHRVTTTINRSCYPVTGFPPFQCATPLSVRHPNNPQPKLRHVSGRLSQHGSVAKPLPSRSAVVCERGPQPSVLPPYLPHGGAAGSCPRRARPPHFVARHGPPRPWRYAGRYGGRSVRGPLRHLARQSPASRAALGLPPRLALVAPQATRALGLARGHGAAESGRGWRWARSSERDRARSGRDALKGTSVTVAAAAASPRRRQRWQERRGCGSGGGGGGSCCACACTCAWLCACGGEDGTQGGAIQR